LLAVALSAPAAVSAQEPTEICVERVSVVEDAFITVFDARRSGAVVRSTPGDGPQIEYSDEGSSASDNELIEYGDHRSAAPGLDVVRGDETPLKSQGVDVVRGDQAADSKAIDVFRGDESQTDERPRPSLEDLDLLSMGSDQELAQLASLDPTNDGFVFGFDGLELDVMGTPMARNLGEAFEGLTRSARTPARMRIDTAKTGCTRARLDARKGLLQLESKAGHWLEMVFSKAKKINAENLPQNASIYEFDSRLKLKLKRGKKRAKSD